MNVIMNSTKRVFSIIRQNNTQLFHNNIKLMSVMYTNNHETIQINNNIMKVGLSKYALEELGEIVFVDSDLETGDIIDKNDTLCTIESVKSTEDIDSLCDGEFMEYNENTINNFKEIHNIDEKDSWLVKLKFYEIDKSNFMNYEEYNSYVKKI